MSIQLYQGDCLDILKTLDANSVDSVVTDPPYGLSLMSKKWDYNVPSSDIWQEVLRVLKPGGFLLSFAGTRTYHRMVVNIEDAGFDILDQIGWCFASGFPKSMNIAKAMEKAGFSDADQWDGLGTCLKPAWEPIVIAQKHVIGTIIENVRNYGTGALNIDACRVPTSDKLGGGAEKQTTPDQKGNEGWTRPWMDDETAREAHAARVRENVSKAEELGRFPANIIHDGSDEVLELFEFFGEKGGGGKPRVTKTNEGRTNENYYRIKPTEGTVRDHGDTGTAARFWYCAKASKKERAGSDHPTIKPVELMKYLCRLVTPPHGVVLDPFAGTGTTGEAAATQGFDAILIEREDQYCDRIRERLQDWMGESWVSFS